MSKQRSIIVVANSGAGKSTSLGCIPELGHKGLDESETFLFNVSSRGLPFKNNYQEIDDERNPTKGNMYSSNSPGKICRMLKYIIESRPDIKNVVIDDFQYIMQDYFMAHGLEGGYDAFKVIGQDIAKIMALKKKFVDRGGIFIALSHMEEVTAGDKVIKRKIKTVGKMVDQYVTLEGKFDIVLFMDVNFDKKNNKVNKYFVTNYNGKYEQAKSPFGMFDEVEIPNDLGYVLEKVNEFNKTQG